MKDRQPRSPSPDTAIPIVSAFCHYVAMSVIVFWRRRFGIAFLNSMSVFCCIAYVSGLYTIYA